MRNISHKIAYCEKWKKKPWKRGRERRKRKSEIQCLSKGSIRRNSHALITCWMNTTRQESRPPRSALSYIIQTLLVAAVATVVTVATPNHRVIKHTAAERRMVVVSLTPRCTVCRHKCPLDTRVECVNGFTFRWWKALAGPSALMLQQICRKFPRKRSHVIGYRRLILLRQMCRMRWLIAFYEISRWRFIFSLPFIAQP